MLQKLKDNKILVAVVIGVAAAVDYAFGLGLSQYVIDFVASGGADAVVVP